MTVSNHLMPNYVLFKENTQAVREHGCEVSRKRKVFHGTRTITESDLTKVLGEDPFTLLGINNTKAWLEYANLLYLDEGFTLRSVFFRNVEGVSDTAQRFFNVLADIVEQGDIAEHIQFEMRTSFPGSSHIKWTLVTNEVGVLFEITNQEVEPLHAVYRFDQLVEEVNTLLQHCGSWDNCSMRCAFLSDVAENDGDSVMSYHYKFCFLLANLIFNQELLLEKSITPQLVCAYIWSKYPERIGTIIAVNSELTKDK